jgi:broad specificity phosphatase PhoE
VLSFFEELSRSQEKVLIVSHAGVGRMIETIKYGKDPKLFYDIPAYPNASINEVVLAK